ncbi:Holliday junction resolvase RuvX [Kordiimonas sp. SCSIO 12610]|uniref:Holliday junction resolvase RuvX n=1 Tax=Kordiimonas sp. SCSIO 12610 TaxID=2829597 RepID=UPI00210A096F|nr:Holliday junction resolvase RuvX [Kordiimonas sp. SCSIO 12610]UTW54251.1 Holliday junction resolvase RuvX [Kordiimonas sp. SCSIO 12610]
MSHLLSIQEIKSAIPNRKRLLGLDVGSKTIGLALSDTMLMIATPMEIIRRKRFKDDAARLEEIVKAEDVGGFIIGWPVNMDGSEGPRCQSTRAFSDNLYAKIPLPQAFWDERLSTAAVERTLIEADSSRARRKEVVDKLAASYILQGALHAL